MGGAACRAEGIVTMTRNDVHRPVNLVTEDYTYISGYDNAEGDPAARGGGKAREYQMFGRTTTAYSPVGASRQILARMVRESTSTPYHNGHQCDHCGAAIRYVGVLLHIPTDDYVAVGETCLNNRFSQATRDFQRLRKEAQLDRKAAKIRKEAADFRDSHQVDWAALDASQNSFVKDVLAKLERWGSISDKQLECDLRRLWSGTPRRQLSPRRPRAPCRRATAS